jgi:E3 ubiquitin-protein ligase TRIP12
VLEVEYFDEAGTGLGPTLEFYSLVSKEFARRDLKLWRDTDQSHPGLYVHHPNGLFPAPINPDDDGGQCVNILTSIQSFADIFSRKRTHIFRVVGQFVAKAMLDSRMIDLSLNKIFVKLVLGEEVPLTMSTLKVSSGISAPYSCSDHSFAS